MITSIYKPKGPTSNDILTQVKKITGIKKVGHAGTLDPLACGVLVVGIGRESTKLLNSIVQKEKEYLAKIKLGMESSTDDEEGEKIVFDITLPPSLFKIEKTIKKFIGKIKQTPPIYSAIKISGKEAYKFARKGHEVKLNPREVEIKNIEILNYSWPLLELKVITGPGVYIRALARDLGKSLNTGGYLAGLERTRVGEFKKETSLTLDQLKNQYPQMV